MDIYHKKRSMDWLTQYGLDHPTKHGHLHKAETEKRALPRPRGRMLQQA